MLKNDLLLQPGASPDVAPSSLEFAGSSASAFADLDSPVRSPAYSLQFPSHHSAVENCLLTFGTAHRTAVDQQLASVHRHVVESVMDGVRVLSADRALMDITRHMQRASSVFLGDELAQVWLGTRPDELVTPENTGRIILTSNKPLSASGFLLDRADMLIIDGRFSTDSAGFYQSMRMMGMIRGITGSSHW